jgi:protoporphyrinogen oxidase
VTHVDKDTRVVTLSTGKKIQYDSLLSTIPLDIMLTWNGKKEWADGLQHSSSHIVGFGFRGTR